MQEMTGASALGTAMQSVARISALKNNTRSPGRVPTGTFATCRRRAARVRCMSSFCKQLAQGLDSGNQVVSLKGHATHLQG